MQNDNFGIIGAALNLPGDIVVHGPRPLRHHHLLNMIGLVEESTGGRIVQPEEQGFWCEDQTFRGRESAWRYACRNGWEPDDEKIHVRGTLFSEDLW